MRVAGIVVAVLFAGYGIARYRDGRWRRMDLLLALLVASGIGVISVFPQVGDLLTRALQLNNRGIAFLVASNLVLFGLFFYILGQVRAANRKAGEIVRAIASRRYTDEYLAGPRGTPEEAPPVPAAREEEKLLVVIPAYNEEESLPGVLGRIPREVCGLPVETVVVVDGGTDGTAAVAAERGYPVAPHIVNRGQGDALRTGFEIARLERAAIVANLDADGQHQPEELHRLVAPIVRGEADFVMGSRFLGEYEDAGGARHLGIVLFSLLISLLAGRKITDCTNGYRAIRGRDLDRLDLREDRYSTAELILQAAKHGLRIREVPISILARTDGESKKPKRLAYPLGFLRVILQTWLR